MKHLCSTLFMLGRKWRAVLDDNILEPCAFHNRLSTLPDSPLRHCLGCAVCVTCVPVCLVVVAPCSFFGFKRHKAETCYRKHTHLRPPSGALRRDPPARAMATLGTPKIIVGNSIRT